jgi:hypothetical protein
MLLRPWLWPLSACRLLNYFKNFSISVVLLLIVIHNRICSHFSFFFYKNVLFQVRIKKYFIKFQNGNYTRILEWHKCIDYSWGDTVIVSSWHTLSSHLLAFVFLCPLAMFTLNKVLSSPMSLELNTHTHTHKLSHIYSLSLTYTHTHSHCNAVDLTSK